MTDWLVADVSGNGRVYLNCAAGRLGNTWTPDRTQATRFCDEDTARCVAADQHAKAPWAQFEAEQL